MKNIQKICIINVGLLGDVLMRTPVIRELRKLYPKAEITCIVDPIGKEILSLNSDIDKLKVINRSKNNRIKYLYSKLDMQLFIIKEKFDLVIDLYGGSSTTTMLKFNFAPYKIGFKDNHPWSNKLVYKEDNSDVVNPYHLSHVYLKVLNFFDCEYSHSTKPVLNSSQKAKENIKEYIDSFETIDKDKIFLVSFGSGGLEKILDFEKQFAMIKYIYEEFGYIPAIVSNPGQEFLQEDFINNYMNNSDIPYIKLKQLNLDEITALMSLVKFVFLPDTGLYHMAVGVGASILCIFTYTNPILVEPDEGIFQACFKEIDKKDVNGITLGRGDLEKSYLFECISIFIKSYMNKMKK